MTISRLAVTPAIVALLAASNLGAAHAIDVVVENGQVLTSVTLSNPDDTLTVKMGGELSSSGHALIVESSAVGAGIINHGNIRSSSTSDWVVDLQAANASLVNYGGIYSDGACAYGVYATDSYFSLTNYGTIQTFGSSAATGVWANGPLSNALNTLINNYGNIVTEGANSSAVSVYGTGTRINNSGLISASGDGSVGVYAYSSSAESGVVITNTGTIRGSGGEMYPDDGPYLQGHAIQTKAADVHIINSGTVISERFDAFAMEFANSKLTLLPGSVISGGIRFSKASSGFLEIGSGLDGVLKIHGELQHDQINTHGQAYKLEHKTEATEHQRTGDSATTTYSYITVLSTASIEAGNAATTQTASTITASIASHTGDRRQSLSRGTSALGYAPAPSTPDFPDFAPSDDFGIWASAYGELTAPTNGNTGSKSLQGGALVGMDVQLTDESLAGLFAGLGRGHVESASKSELDITSLIGGGYASLAVGSVFVDINASVGVSANDSQRRFVNNTVAAGYEAASANYVSMFASPSIKLGMDHDIGVARVTPSVTLTYAGVYQTGYTENGSSANVTMGSSLAHVLNARAELEIGTINLRQGGNGWSTSAKIGADGTISGGGAAEAQLLGQTLNLPNVSANSGRGFVGANAEYKVGNFTLNAGTELGLTTTGMFSAGIRGGIGSRF